MLITCDHVFGGAFINLDFLAVFKQVLGGFAMPLSCDNIFTVHVWLPSQLHVGSIETCASLSLYSWVEGEFRG